MECTVQWIVSKYVNVKRPSIRFWVSAAINYTRNTFSGCYTLSTVNYHRLTEDEKEQEQSIARIDRSQYFKNSSWLTHACPNCKLYGNKYRRRVSPYVPQIHCSMHSSKVIIYWWIYFASLGSPCVIKKCIFTHSGLSCIPPNNNNNIEFIQISRLCFVGCYDRTLCMSGCVIYD